MIPRIERDFIVANLAAVDSVLDKMTPSDFLTRMSLESQREELQQQLASFDAVHRPLASAALFFSGQPVVSSRGIESEFGSQVISRFQDMVSKVYAAREMPALGQRGPVPGRVQSKLYVTHIVHGSVGFQFEELDDPSLFNSDLKESVDQTTKIMAYFDEATDEELASEVEGMDKRVLDTMRDFFTYVESKGARFRVVSPVVDKSYDQVSLQRAVKRAETTTINERDEWVSGQVLGIFPEQRTFEFRTESNEVIHGKVDMLVESKDLPSMVVNWLQQKSRAAFRVRELARQGQVYRRAYRLIDIVAETG
jgi:hypothetical protein